MLVYLLSQIANVLFLKRAAGGGKYGSRRSAAAGSLPAATASAVASSENRGPPSKDSSGENGDSKYGPGPDESLIANPANPTPAATASSAAGSGDSAPNSLPLKPGGQSPPEDQSWRERKYHRPEHFRVASGEGPAMGAAAIPENFGDSKSAAAWFGRPSMGVVDDFKGLDSKESKSATGGPLSPPIARAVPQPLPESTSILPYSPNTISLLIKFYDVSHGLVGEKPLKQDKSKKLQIYFYSPQQFKTDVNLLALDQIAYLDRCQKRREKPCDRRVCFLLNHNENLIALIVTLSGYKSHTDKVVSYDQIEMELIGYNSTGKDDPLQQQLVNACEVAYGLKAGTKQEVKTYRRAQSDPTIFFTKQCINAMNGKDAKGKDTLSEKTGPEIDRRFRAECANVFKVALGVWQKKAGEKYPAIREKLFAVFKYSFLDAERQKLNVMQVMLTADKFLAEDDPKIAERRFAKKLRVYKVRMVGACSIVINNLELAVKDLPKASGSPKMSFEQCIKDAPHFSHIEFLLSLFECASGADQLSVKLDQLSQTENFRITQQWESTVFAKPPVVNAVTQAKRAREKLWGNALLHWKDDKQLNLIKEKLVTLLQQIYLRHQRNQLSVSLPAEKKLIADNGFKYKAQLISLNMIANDADYWPEISALIKMLNEYKAYPTISLLNALDKEIEKNNIAATQWEKQNLPENPLWRTTKDQMIGMARFLGLVGTFSCRGARRAEEIARYMLGETAPMPLLTAPTKQLTKVG